MRRTSMVLAAPILLALAGVAGAGAGADELAADPPPAAPTWTVDVGSQARWWIGDGAAALAPEAMVGGQAAIGRKLWRLRDRGGMDIAGFARFGSGGARGMLFQTLDTAIDQMTFTAGLRLELPVRRWLRVVALVEMGAARTAVTI